MEEADQPRAVDVVGMELHPDATTGTDEELHTALPPRLEAWRRRSAAGVLLTGFGLGLKEVFEAPREEAAVVMETSGEPPTDLSVEADLGGILPGDKVVKIRPWLLAPPGGDPDRTE